MSSRFHDKWHGANHNSVSAIGIPDAGRDPIASYIFPYEGEFIMNNSPRHNGGEDDDNKQWGLGHSEYTSQEVFDKWVLSSNRIDSNIIRSQQDEAWGEIVLSAQHKEDPKTVLTLRGTHNRYNLQVNGEENSEDFLCTDREDGTSRQDTFRRRTIRVGNGTSSEVREYTDGLDLERIVSVRNDDFDGGASTSQTIARANTYGIYVTDASGTTYVDNVQHDYREPPAAQTEDSPDNTAPIDDDEWESPEITNRNLELKFDGTNHTIEAKAGKLVETHHSDTGNLEIHRFDRADGDGSILRDRIEIFEESPNTGNAQSGGMLMMHRFEQTPEDADRQWVGIQISGGATNVHGHYNVPEGQINLRSYSITERAKNERNAFVGNHPGDSNYYDTEAILGGQHSIVAGNRRYETTKTHETTANSIHTTANHDIYGVSKISHIALSGKNGIYLNDGTSIKNYDDFVSNGQHPYIAPPGLLPTEPLVFSLANSKGYPYTVMTTDCLVVSAYNPEEYAKDIWMTNSNAFIPNLYANKVTATEASFSSFSALSGVVKYVDIVQSDLSGFVVRGKRNEAMATTGSIVADMTKGTLYLSGAALYGDQWGYIRNDFETGRNVKVGSGITIKSDEVVNGRVIIASGDIGIGQATGKSMLGTPHKLYVQGDIYATSDMTAKSDVSAGENIYSAKNLYAGGAAFVGGNLDVTGAATIGLDANVSGVLTVGNAIKAKDDIFTDYSVYAEGCMEAKDYMGAPTGMYEVLNADSITSYRTNHISIESPASASNLDVHRLHQKNGIHFGNFTTAHSYDVSGISIGEAISNNGQSSSAINIGYKIENKNGVNTIAIGNDITVARNVAGHPVAVNNSIAIGKSTINEDDIFKVFDHRLMNTRTGKIDTDAYAFYEGAGVYHFPTAYADTLSSHSIAGFPVSNLGATTVHDGLTVDGGPGLSVNGNAYVSNAMSAHEYWIVRNSGHGEVIAQSVGEKTPSLECIPLEQAISEQIGKSIESAISGIRSARSMARSINDEGDSSNPRIVSVADVVDEARRVSYVEKADHVEFVESSVVDHAEVVENADQAARIGRVSSAGIIDYADIVNVYGIIDAVSAVQNAESVNYADEVASAGSLSCAKAVSSAASVLSAGNIKNSLGVANTVTVSKTDYVGTANTVEKASNVKEIVLAGGRTLRGPAISPVSVSKDGYIDVNEWTTTYKTTSKNIVLGGLAEGWKDEENDLSFMVRIRPEETPFTISVKGDKEITWMGPNATRKKLTGAVTVWFTVASDEILAKTI